MINDHETFNTTNVFDVWTSVKRYYNNVFSDNEKQMSINLFLGVFQPYEHKHLMTNQVIANPTNDANQKKVSEEPEADRIMNLWELHTDYFMHMKSASTKLVCNTEWYKHEIKLAEILADPDFAIEPTENQPQEQHHSSLNNNDLADQYTEFYDLEELTEFDTELQLEFNNILRPFEQSQPETDDGASRIKQWLSFTSGGEKRRKTKKNPPIGHARARSSRSFQGHTP